MRPYRTRLQYSHLQHCGKTHRLVAGSALIVFLCRSGRRKEKKMEVARKTTAVRRRTVRWTRRLCSGRISKSERRSALTHLCIWFIVHSQLQNLAPYKFPLKCLCSNSLCVFIEQLDENSMSSDSTQDGGTNYFLQYMGSAG